jgi:GNAT superfamily N-acetyltransferase
MAAARTTRGRDTRAPSPPVAPTYREVLEPGDRALPKVHALIRQTFPPYELVGRSEWRASLRERAAGLWSDSRWHLVIAEHKGAVLGVASGTYLGNVNVGVVGYLAVSPAARGFGVGPKLRGKLRSIFREDAKEITGETLDAVIGEVRRDNPWLRRLVRSDTVLALDFTYFQPRLRPSDRPVPLVLYYEGIAEVRQRLPAARVRMILYSLWRRIYRVPRPMAHGAFRRMLHDLDGRTTIGEIKLSDLPPPVKSPNY